MPARPDPPRARFEPERGSSGTAPDVEATKEEGLEEPSLLGRLLSGKWRVDRLLGQGGVSSVYEATHRNGRRAAIKVLSAEFSGNRRIRGRFQREGYLANRVAHPGAVEILDDDVSGDVAYLVMELLEGMTLDALRVARGGRLPLPEALWAGIELLDVLHAAHSRGILHRDVKPGNVFVTRAGELKLLDFGIASLREGSDASGITETGIVLGTPGFMAPEQARGRADELGPATDVYAVGATLFRLLSGRLVHEGATSGELQIAVATKDAPALSNVAPELPRELGRVVDRALARGSTKRFQSAAAMKQALSEAAAAMGVAPTPPPLDGDPITGVRPSERAAFAEAPRRGRHAVRTVLVVGAAAVLVGGLVVASRWGATSASVEPAGAVSAAIPAAPQVPELPLPTSAEATPARPAAPEPAPALPTLPAVKSATPPRVKSPAPAGTPRPRPATGRSATTTPSSKPPLELLKQRL